MPYPSYINYIQSHEPVVSSVANRPSMALDKRTAALKDRMDAAELGQALILSDVPLAAESTKGSPVYWNDKNHRFELAYATAELNTETAEYNLSDAAHCIGLVYEKTSDISGSIVLHGIVSLPEVFETLNTTDAGILYLGYTPGSLSVKPLGINVMLGQLLGAKGECGAESLIYVNPEYNRQLTHSHFSVDLRPVIVMTGSTPGWRAVPATDTKAPEGAVLSYNVTSDARLNAFFPPIPLYSVSCTVDWGDSTETIGGKVLTVNKSDSLIRVTHTGVYWMSSTVLPYPTVSIAAPRVFRVTLNFSKVDYSARHGGVTSMQPDTNQPLRFVDCTGEESQYGDLFAQFTLKCTELDSTDYTGRAMRRFNDEWKQEIVPTINGVYSPSNQVHLTGTRTFSSNDKAYTAGLLDLTVDPVMPNHELTPQILRLGSALERDYNGIQFVGLPYGRESSVIGKMEIPANFPGQLTFKVRLLLLAQEAGTYPNITMTLAQIARPGSTALNVSSLAHNAMTLTVSQEVQAGSVFEVESSEVTVMAGDTLIVTLNRSNEASSYLSDVGIVRFNGIVNIGA